MEIFTRDYSVSISLTNHPAWVGAAICFSTRHYNRWVIRESFLSWSTAYWSSSQPCLPLYFSSTSFSRVIEKTHCQSIFTLKIEICIFLKVCLLRWCSGYEGAWVPWCPSGRKAFYLCSLSVGLFRIIDNKKYWTQSLKIQAVEHFLL